MWASASAPRRAPDLPCTHTPTTYAHAYTKTKHSKQIAAVLEARCHYTVLAVPRSASDDDVKRAYRQLALRLHPDKCGAPRAPDAFRAVSRAFACLSDPARRRTYDRTGVDPDDPAVAHGGARRRTTGGHPRPGGGGGFYGGGFPDTFDAEELFNAFFGGAFGGPFGGMGGGPFDGPGVRFGGGFGGAPPPRRRRAGGPQQPSASDDPSPPPWAALLAQLAPLLLLLLLAILPGGSDPPVRGPAGGTPGLASPPVSLDARPPLYGVRLETPPPAAVPFYVASARAFDAAYPPGSRGRARIEGAAEEAYRDRLVRACGVEKRRRAASAGGGGGSGGGGWFGWGRPEVAAAYDTAADMPACEELNTRFGG